MTVLITLVLTASLWSIYKLLTNFPFTAEEIQQASKVIPFSIWFSTLFNGVLGFAMMVLVLFSMGDIKTATQSVTGFPFMDVFVRALGSLSGGSALVRSSNPSMY